MALNSGNIYSIPEHPSEEEFEEEMHSTEYKSVTETIIYTGTKKISSTSLPEKPHKFSIDDLRFPTHSIPTLITPEIKYERNDHLTECRTFKKGINRLSVSLIDIPKFRANPDSGTYDTDKDIAFANAASSQRISVRNSKSYLDVQDCISHLNSEPEYETLLSSSVIQNGNSNSGQTLAKNSVGRCSKDRKYSDNLVFIDLNEDSSTCYVSDDASGSSVSRPRSRSMQWIQNTFQSVSNKYKSILEIRRPSDIVEERMRRSKEELDMEESSYEEITVQSSPSSRRFSENEIGKQKRSLPFTSRLGNLKDLWNRNHLCKKQIDKNIDQTRTDVCPLFSFPRNRDEDEKILDALRQAMRKCTAVDPSTRPSSSLVLEHLVTLVK